MGAASPCPLDKRRYISGARAPASNIAAAARWIDSDDIGTELGEGHTARGTGDEGRALHHAKAVEGSAKTNRRLVAGPG